MRTTLYLLGLIGGLLAAYPMTIFSGFKRVQTDAEDSLHLQYMLEHGFRWLTDVNYKAEFWSPAFFYPAPHTLAYSENMMGAAPFYWLLRAFFSPAIAVQWWVLLMAAANYGAMAYALRRFGLHPILATLGAYVFAFSLPRQENHPNLLVLPQCFTPLAICYFWSFVQNPRRGSFALTLLFAAWQLLASMHLGWFLGFALTSWSVFVIIFDRPAAVGALRFAVRNPAFVSLSLAAFGGGLALFFRHYLSSGLTAVAYGEAMFFAPSIEEWTAATPTSLWAFRPVGQQEVLERERFLFVGLSFWLALLAALLFGWENRRNPERRRPALLALTASITCLWLLSVTLKVGLETSAWGAIRAAFPGASGIRAVNRVVMVVIPLGLVAGLTAVQCVVESRVSSPFRRRLVYAALLLLAAGEQLRWDAPTMDRRQADAVSTELARQVEDADAVYFVLDRSDGSADLQPTDCICMWAGLKANTPVINGYSSREPSGYARIREGAHLPELLRFLGRDWSGRLLVVELGPPDRRTWYSVAAGGDTEGRARIVRTDGPPR